MHRFFIDTGLQYNVGNRIDITDKEDVKHLVKVLRVRIDEMLEICDGEDREYRVKVCEMKHDSVKTEVVAVLDLKRESEIQITLFQSLPKGHKMELILQKSVELGVYNVVPVVTERCVSKIKDAKTERNKLERWQKVMNEAAKQSKRGLLPHIKPVKRFQDLEADLKAFDLLLMPHVLGEQKHLKDVLNRYQSAQKIGILIGPEGGFSEDEVALALEWGAQPIKLGPRILRTETAGFVTSSIVMYELGDIGG